MNIVFNRMYPKCPIHHSKNVRESETNVVEKADVEFTKLPKYEDEIYLYDRHACLVHGFKRGIEVNIYA